MGCNHRLPSLGGCAQPLAMACDSCAVNTLNIKRPACMLTCVSQDVFGNFGWVSKVKCGRPVQVGSSDHSFPCRLVLQSASGSFSCRNWRLIPRCCLHLTTLPTTHFHFTECFGEFQLENVAAIFTGWLHTPASGAYAFTLESDDGSRLFLDGSLVVDNGGEQSLNREGASATLCSASSAITRLALSKSITICRRARVVGRKCRHLAGGWLAPAAPGVLQWRRYWR